MLDAENPTPPAEETSAEGTAAEDPAKKVPAKRATAKTATKKAATKKAATKKTVAKSTSTAETKKAPANRTAKKAAEALLPEPAETQAATAAAPSATMLLFQPPEPTKAPPRKKKPVESRLDEASEAAEGASPDGETDDTRPAQKQGQKQGQGQGQKQGQGQGQKQGQGQGHKQGQAPSAKSTGDQGGGSRKASGQDESQDFDTDDDADGEGGNRRRRRRGGRRRRKPGDPDSDTPEGSDGPDDAGTAGSDTDSDDSAGTHRRRRRRRTGDDADTAKDDPEKTVTRVRKPRAAEDEITSLTGSTRLEAKKVRRREGREAGRRRAPIASEAEFLARREAVERVMVIRQKEDLTQIAVLEDKVLVEHYVARNSQTSLIGNVYLGRVQNVLPSMEAAFIDIGKGRNAVIYAGEVNWGSLGAKGGGQRKIEQVLKSGQSVLVQVSKDPIGHKGARLTGQISVPGRFLVYVPDGTTSGISRKLPDTERNRLKTLLKEIVPDTAGVIVRTAAEGASEEELTRDVERLTARWEDIESRVSGGNAPQLLYGEPDLTLKVVRDLFTEDFGKLVVSGADAWDVVNGYVKQIAPDLEERLVRHDGAAEGRDVFAEYRIDEQIAKGLDRKVWLPSGGSLVIDRTEAMTVVDVNTGKFTGSGGNLEETVTRNNLEAAEEIVRQLRLRDIGGIIVVDFIDMVLESNRDLVLRRMVECLGRDRTRHQVAEVTSLGLVQMTRKRIGTGLLEAFSETCEHCQGRGVLVRHEPIDPQTKSEDEPRRNRRSGRSRGRGGEENGGGSSVSSAPSPKDVAAVAKPENADKPPVDGIETPVDETAVQPESIPPEGRPPPRQRKRAARREQGPAATPAESKPAESKPAESKPAESKPAESKPAEPSSSELTTAQAPIDSDNSAPTQAVVPRVVTSVRRRGPVSRPAGPPTGFPTSAVDGVASEPEAGEDVATVSQPHVPVKRKGSRKR